MKYSMEVYENWDPFEGDRDVDIRLETRKIVKVRKTHICNFETKPHKIKPRSMAMVDRAIVDGKWCSQYFCIDHVDKWLEEFVEVE